MAVTTLFVRLETSGQSSIIKSCSSVLRAFKWAAWPSTKVGVFWSPKKMRRGEQKKSDQKRLFPSLPTPHAMLVTQWRRRVYIHRAGHKRGDASTKSCFFFLPRHQVTYIYKSYQQLHLDASCHSSVASIPNDERNRLAYAETGSFSFRQRRPRLCRRSRGPSSPRATLTTIDLVLWQQQKPHRSRENVHPAPGSAFDRPLYNIYWLMA